MTDIVLNKVTTGYNLSNINTNFDKIQEKLNDDTLHVQGGGNVLKQDLDFNGYRALNMKLGGLVAPTAPTDAVRLLDLTNEAGVRQSKDDSLQTQINNILANQGSGLIGYATLAALNADLSRPDNTVAIVTNDPTVNNNTTYRKVGAAGTGSWVVSVDRITNFATSLASSTGSASVGFLQTGTGAVARTLLDKVREIVVTPEDFGAVGNGIADDTLPIQRAVNYCQSLAQGGVVKFSRNKNYKITATIVNDRSVDPVNIQRVSFIGEDECTTFITSTVGTAFSIKNAQTGGGGEPNVSNQTVRGLTIIGPSKASNSAGLLLELCSNIHIENVRIQNFDYAIYAQDMDQAYLKRCELRFNNIGIFARKNPSAGVASTQPNNWVLIQCGIGSNSNYGCQWIGGSTISFFGGIIATNGTGYAAGVTGFGAAFTDCGYEGGVGPNFYGTYFEDNNGIADVIVQSTTTQGVPITQCVYNFYGCSFNRINGNTSYAVNSIRAIFGQVADVGQQKVVVHGCSFKSLGSYVPNASRPYIAYTGLAANKDNFYEFGNLYEDAVERPTFINKGNQPAVKVSRTVSSAVANAADTVIPLDTANIADTWFGSFSGNGVVIPEDGWYAFGAQQIFTTAASGFKSLSVLRAGTVVSTGTTSGTGSIVACSGMDFFTAGQIVTISVRQESGSGMTVAGSGTANSYLSLKRMA